MVREGRYFVLHAPRQTGKTSALLALRDLLNSGVEGAYRCVYVNVEVGQVGREDLNRTMRAVLTELAREAKSTLGDESLAEAWPDVLETVGPDAALGETLARWCEAGPAPLILLIDEIDALVDDSLLAVLRQLRAGYPRRPASVPHSVVLCGVRDVRDYRIRSSTENAVIAGGSAFDVKAKSLRLGDFSQDQTHALLLQHTAETGQAFTRDALDAVWSQTRGQPWLVNALAYEACFWNEAGRDRTRAITSDDIVAAQEQLILGRETHLDQLADKLQEDRVRRVIEPLLTGGDKREFSTRDIEYVRDLGLIAHAGPLRIANPIYAEAIPRELTYATQIGLAEDTAWYVDAGSALNVDKLLAAFQVFFREHSEHWVQRFDYIKADPQLLLQAFLQRVVNGGGRIEREYGLGRGRTDLLIVWPQGEATRRFVVECKVLHKSLERTVRDSLDQTAAYMDRCGAEEGHLVLFDRTDGKAWADKLFRREVPVDGATITVWGM